MIASTKGGLKMRITAHLFSTLLGQDLYPDNGSRIWELVRNGASASMDEDLWDPTKPDIEIHLVSNHPLCSEDKTLIILDHGRGFNEPGLQRFCDIGKSREELARRQHGYHHGASHKGIGRWAAPSLNEEALAGNWDTGFYIFTRNQASGKVTMITLIPNQIEKTQEIPIKEIDPDNTDLGKLLKGIKGSFTAIVIPFSAYHSAKDIVQDLRWRLPRKRNLLFKVRVNGEVISTPQLASELTITDTASTVECYLQKSEQPEMQGPETGIWLCDAATGFRVTSLARIASLSAVPDPLWSPRLSGDIFIPNLLVNQDTSRTGLKQQYLRSAAWKKAISFMYNQVAPQARDLLGDEEGSGVSEMDRTMQELVAQIHAVFGKPQITGPPGPPGPPKPPTPPGPPQPPKTRRIVNGTPRNRQHAESQPVKIEGEIYYLATSPLDQDLLAEVDYQSGNRLFINSQYQKFPRSKQAKNQHILEEVFGAIGGHRFAASSRDARKFKNRCLDKMRVGTTRE